MKVWAVLWLSIFWVGFQGLWLLLLESLFEEQGAGDMQAPGATDVYALQSMVYGLLGTWELAGR